MLIQSLCYLSARVLEIYIAKQVTDSSLTYSFGFTMNGKINVDGSQGLLFLADGEWKYRIYTTEPLDKSEKVFLFENCRHAALLPPMPGYLSALSYESSMRGAPSSVKRTRSYEGRDVDSTLGEQSIGEDRTTMSGRKNRRHTWEGADGSSFMSTKYGRSLTE